jgi:hypothetical protein
MFVRLTLHGLVTLGKRLPPTQKGYYMGPIVVSRAEDIENKVSAVEGVHSTQVYAKLATVSFLGIPFTHYHVQQYFPPCRQLPPKKGNSQMDSSVRITRQLLSLFSNTFYSTQPFLNLLLLSRASPPSYQYASSQARLKSCWALPPCAYLL